MERKVTRVGREFIAIHGRYENMPKQFTDKFGHEYVLECLHVDSFSDLFGNKTMDAVAAECKARGFAMVDFTASVTTEDNP